MKIRLAVQLCIGVIGLAAPLAAQGSRWWSWPADPDPQAVERGRPEFVRSCGRCHADNLTGTPKGPNLIRTARLRKDADGTAVAAVVRAGIPAKMPSFQLGDEAMSDLIAYMRWAVQKYDRVSPGAPPDDYPVERLLTGNAAAGKAFFNGAGGCNACHSPTGDLAGIAKKYPPVFLQARFLMPRPTKPRTADVTVVSGEKASGEKASGEKASGEKASGEKVSGELKVLNTYDVTLVSGGKTLTWPADQVKVDVHDPLAPHRALLPKYKDDDVHNMFAYLWTLQ